MLQRSWAQSFPFRALPSVKVPLGVHLRLYAFFFLPSGWDASSEAHPLGYNTCHKLSSARPECFVDRALDGGKGPLVSDVNLIIALSHCVSLRASFYYTRLSSLCVVMD